MGQDEQYAVMLNGGNICPWNNQQKSNCTYSVNGAETSLDDLLSTQVFINERGVKGILDCGASISIMSADVAKRLKFRISPTNIKIKLADSTDTPVVGETEILSVNVSGIVVNLKFIVINNNHHDILLGLDWFLATGASI